MSRRNRPEQKRARREEREARRREAVDAQLAAKAPGVVARLMRAAGVPFHLTVNEVRCLGCDWYQRNGRHETGGMRVYRAEDRFAHGEATPQPGQARRLEVTQRISLAAMAARKLRREARA